MSCCNYYLTEDEAIDIQLGTNKAMTTEDKINAEIEAVRKLLIEKNRAYGDSALHPINIFSKGNATDSLCARIDDKLSRIAQKGINDATEDTVQDLIGYLVLLRISIPKEESSEPWTSNETSTY